MSRILVTLRATIARTPLFLLAALPILTFLSVFPYTLLGHEHRVTLPIIVWFHRIMLWPQLIVYTSALILAQSGAARRAGFLRPPTWLSSLPASPAELLAYHVAAGLPIVLLCRCVDWLAVRIVCGQGFPFLSDVLLFAFAYVAGLSIAWGIRPALGRFLAACLLVLVLVAWSSPSHILGGARTHVMMLMGIGAAYCFGAAGMTLLRLHAEKPPRRILQSFGLAASRLAGGRHARLSQDPKPFRSQHRALLWFAFGQSGWLLPVLVIGALAVEFAAAALGMLDRSSAGIRHLRGFAVVMLPMYAHVVGFLVPTRVLGVNGLRRAPSILQRLPIEPREAAWAILQANALSLLVSWLLILFSGVARGDLGELWGFAGALPEWSALATATASISTDGLMIFGIAWILMSIPACAGLSGRPGAVMGAALAFPLIMLYSALQGADVANARIVSAGILTAAVTAVVAGVTVAACSRKIVPWRACAGVLPVLLVLLGIRIAGHEGNGTGSDLISIAPRVMEYAAGLLLAFAPIVVAPLALAFRWRSG